MDQIKTGELIRTLRQKQNLTQAALADKIGVSDKAVSKWERGCGAPDISLLPALAGALQTDVKVLLNGDIDKNAISNGNLKKLKFYVCADCGNLLFTTEEADVTCCGKKLTPLVPKKAADGEKLSVEPIENEWFISSAHEMRRDHYISFIAFLTGDTLIVKKLYPEWDMETRIPYFRHGLLFWHCTRDGLYYQPV